MKYFGIIFCSLITFFPAKNAHAQFELGVLGGISTYTGDIAKQNTFFSTGDYNAAFGGFARYTFHPLIAARVGFNYSNLSGTDAKSTDGARFQRNLSFKTKLYEISLIGEFNILGYQPYNLVRPWSPYLFAGVAGFVFNPQAELDGVFYDLQPLGTEGQGLEGNEAPYKLTQFSIPAGMGIKYAINDQWNLGLELGGRKTFTDYIDDISRSYVADEILLINKGEVAAALANRTGEVQTGGGARGSYENDDWYFIGGLTISYNFTDNGLVGSRNRKRGGKKGCPASF